MTDRITAVLSAGIRSTIEDQDPDAFKQAALEAYKIRTGGRVLSEAGALINHIFPSDVQQSVQLGLKLVDQDKEKASVIMKGALTAVLERLSVVPSEVVRLPGAEGGSERRWWEVWK